MLPTSTIVLAVATAIPFGLAIRDTVAGTYDTPPVVREQDDEDDEVDPEVEMREAAARYETYLEQQRLERLARRESIKELYGEVPASLGPLFSSIHLGAPVGTSSVTSTSDVQLQLFDDGVQTHSLSVELTDHDDGDCEQLANQLWTTWRDAHSLDNRWIWVNGSQRAVWEVGRCTLTFERISEVTTWFDAGQASRIPLWAIGKPTTELLAALGSASSNVPADDQITWSVIGLGTGYGVAELTADARAGRIVAITATLHTDGKTMTQLSEQISRVTGRQPEIAAERLDTEIWKARGKLPRIQLVEGAPLVLTIGVRPQ